MQADGDSKAPADGKAVGRPRLSSIGHVYAGLSDEEVEVSAPTDYIPPFGRAPLEERDRKANQKYSIHSIAASNRS